MVPQLELRVLGGQKRLPELATFWRSKRRKNTRVVLRHKGAFINLPLGVLTHKKKKIVQIKAVKFSFYDKSSKIICFRRPVKYHFSSEVPEIFFL